MLVPVILTACTRTISFWYIFSTTKFPVVCLNWRAVLAHVFESCWAPANLGGAGGWTYAKFQEDRTPCPKANIRRAGPPQIFGGHNPRQTKGPTPRQVRSSGGDGTSHQILWWPPCHAGRHALGGGVRQNYPRRQARPYPGQGRGGGGQGSAPWCCCAASAQSGRGELFQESSPVVAFRWGAERSKVRKLHLSSVQTAQTNEDASGCQDELMSRHRGRIRLHRKQPQICSWCASNRTDLVKQTANFHCKQWRLTFDGSVSFGWVQTRPEICGAIEYAPSQIRVTVTSSDPNFPRPISSSTNLRSDHSCEVKKNLNGNRVQTHLSGFFIA